jgi:hypothetical protein
MASQLRDAAAQAAAGGQAVEQPAEQSAPNVEGEQGEPTPTERRSASGSAMQQLRSTSG